ncbi:proteasome regulatory particle base subunit RPN10 [Sporobolomyces salmoneus]|uniref:proteasome regulatory particle base subunit RPN10 n=1 Tax=Sporobolomyces salmoneus TaxID=183962 RepID=UPI00317D4715
MSLEATIIVLDNSHYSLNGDYAPTRLEAQNDAVHVLFNSKVRANPENEVGLMVMAGKGPEVLTTLTQDEGKLIAAMHEIKRGGQVDLQTGIQVAQLALKHRQNKNQRQRIIAFVGSPIKDSQASLVKLGKKLKKNNVALDIVSFGSSSDLSLDLSIPTLSSSSASASTSTSTPAEPESNSTKLEALIGAVSSSDNSHFLHVEPGPHLLSEKIMQSPIVRGEGGDEDAGNGGSGGGAGAGGGGEADEFGVDPNLDPELAMALRMSLQEEQARQAAAAAASGSGPTPSESNPASTTAAAQSEPVPEGISTRITDPTGGAAIPTNPTDTTRTAAEVEDVEIGEEGGDEMLTGEGDDEDLDEDEELRRALLLSQGGDDDDIDMLGDGGEGQAEGDEDEDIARAIALSMQDAENQKEPKKE